MNDVTIIGKRRNSNHFMKEELSPNNSLERSWQTFKLVP